VNEVWISSPDYFSVNSFIPLGYSYCRVTGWEETTEQPKYEFYGTLEEMAANPHMHVRTFQLTFDLDVMNDPNYTFCTLGLRVDNFIFSQTEGVDFHDYDYLVGGVLEIRYSLSPELRLNTALELRIDLYDLRDDSKLIYVLETIRFEYRICLLSFELYEPDDAIFYLGEETFYINDPK